MSPVVFSYSKRVVQLCVAFVAVSLNPAPLRALDIGTFGDTTVSLGGNVRAGYAVVSDGDVGHGPTLRYARLKLGARHERAGALKLQMEAASGTVRLLDAVAEIRICDHLRWQAGRYKAPTSLDVQMGSASYAFSRRTFATDVAPGRHVGTSFVFDRGFGSAQGIELHAGVFSVPGAAEPMYEDLLVAGSARVRLAEGVRLHLGVAGQVYREDAPDADIGTVFDAAIEIDRGAVYAIAESAVRTGEVPAGSEREWTAGAWGQVTINTAGAPFDVAPMAGFDFASGRDASPPVNPNADVVRGRGGVTLPWRNAPVTIGVEGDLTSRDSELPGGVFAWGQVAL